MISRYFFPYEIVKLEGCTDHGFIKARIDPRKFSQKLLCCQCHNVWPDHCNCPSTEEEMVRQAKAFLDNHPSVKRDRDSYEEYRNLTGEKWPSITAWREWEEKSK